MMKKKRRQLNVHLFETRQLCEYFHEMALQGWILQKANAVSFTFVKEKPQDLIYSMEIYTKGSYMNPYNINQEQKDYMTFIEEYGYELVARTSNFQIYRSTKPLVPIHSEDSAGQRKEVHKTIIQYEALNHLMFILLTPMMWLNMHNLSFYLIKTNATLCFLLFPLFFTVLTLLKVIPFFLWFIQKDRYQPSLSRILARERLFHISWIFLIITVVPFFLSFNFPDNSIVYQSMLSILILVIVFYGLDFILSKFIKKYHGLIAMVIAMYLFMFTSIKFLMPIPFHQPPAKEAISSFTIAYEDEHGKQVEALNKLTDEKDSILLHTAEYEITVPAPSDDWGETTDGTINESYHVYEAKDTPLHDFTVDKLFTNSHQSYRLAKTLNGWKWYESKRSYIFNKENLYIEINAYATNEALITSLLEQFEY